MLRSNLCDYADAYILVKGTITITGAGNDDAAKRLDERNKDVIFKNCAPFTKCISRINNADIDNAKDIDIVMLMYNLIEYSDGYSRTSESLWQYYDSLWQYYNNSQLNKLKSAIKNETEVVLKLSSNMIDDNEINLPHKLLLTNRQVANIHKAFANNSSTDIKLPKSQLSKMIQSGGCLGRLLGPLLKIGLPLIKNVIKPNVLTPLGLTAAASAEVAGIHKNIFGSVNITTLII